jgi:hypothetical protein
MNFLDSQRQIVLDRKNKMKKTIKFMIEELGYELRCGRHCNGVGYFAVFYMAKDLFPKTNWNDGGHAMKLKDAIEIAADKACGLPTKVANPNEFLKGGD